MAYRPPTTNNYTASTDSDAFPMRRRQQNRVDAEGWEHVSRSVHPSVHPVGTQSRWGQSALAKSQPKPKTREEEYPALGGSRKVTEKPTTPPYPPSSPIELATGLKPSTSSLSMAERMKVKLAEEEAERIRREEQELLRAAQDEKERNRVTGFVPMLSILQSRRIENMFDQREDEDVDMHLYGSDAYGGESDYDYTYDIDNNNGEEYYNDNDNHF